MQGPVERREEPALEIDRAVGFWLERVRIEPRGAGVRELVTGQPHRPAELEVVAGGCLSEAGARAGEIAVSQPPDGGPGGEQSRREPEGQDERYEARTSASKLSKSGTSESAYRHVRRTVPPSPTRTAARSGTSGDPRHSRRSAEPPRELAVPVREQRRLDPERLLPGAMRERRVAGDAEDAHSGGSELGLSVTQEQELLRSGSRPVEEVEEQEDRAVGDEVLELNGLAVLAPHHLASLQGRSDVRDRGSWHPPQTWTKTHCRRGGGRRGQAAPYPLQLPGSPG